MLYVSIIQAMTRESVYMSGAGMSAGRADQEGNFGGIAPCEGLDFAQRHLLGVATDPTLRTAKGQIHDGTFPGHPHGQGAHLVEGDVWRVANTALGRAAGDIVLHSVPGKYLRAPIVHDHREGDGQLPIWGAQDAAHAVTQFQMLSDGVQLPLGNGEWIVNDYGIAAHRMFPSGCRSDQQSVLRHSTTPPGLCYRVALTANPTCLKPPIRI